ncbi:MAG: helix-hairpin-helix domain-containing protein [Gammaproteobacteria bacterium]
MQRSDVKRFKDIPNIGPAFENNFMLLGLSQPTELIGKDPYQMYDDLCTITQKRQDPCVIDVFISAVRYMEGGPSKRWWQFTQERRKHHGN